VFSTCADTIRTLLALARSALQRDAGRPEDVARRRGPRGRRLSRVRRVIAMADG
jgi:hypothetical protein